MQKNCHLILLLIILCGCTNNIENNEVIVYTSVDQHYAEPIFSAFEKKTGIKVRPVFDVEAAKTTGLVNRLISEEKHPKADVFWNGEYAQTHLLASLGLLTSYKTSASMPNNSYLWSTFGGRIRVLIINRKQMQDKPLPNSIFDLVSTKWPAEKIGIALPIFGTTATHAAALWAHLGPEHGADLFNQLQARGIHFQAGNSVVRDKVASGQLWFGITDSDDACGAVARGAPIDLLFPDQQQDKIGTLVIPNTVALIAGGPNKKNGQHLIDHLLSKETEAELSRLGWFHIVDNKITVNNGCPLPDKIKVMPISEDDVVANLEYSRTFLRELLLR